MAKWSSIRLRTKWLRVRITLLSLKLQIWRQLRARSSLTFKQTKERGFTLKLVRDMITTYSQIWTEAALVTKNSLKYIHIKKIHDQFGLGYCTDLPMFHAYSGCVVTLPHSTGRVKLGQLSN